MGSSPTSGAFPFFPSFLLFSFTFPPSLQLLFLSIRFLEYFIDLILHFFLQNRKATYKRKLRSQLTSVQWQHRCAERRQESLEWQSLYLSVSRPEPHPPPPAAPYKDPAIHERNTVSSSNRVKYCDSVPVKIQNHTISNLAIDNVVQPPQLVEDECWHLVELLRTQSTGEE